MAISLAHNVSSYCNSRGLTVFMCSLDAKGAFDAIPHSILLLKSMDVIPDSSWNALYYWYSNMTVCLRWKNTLGEKIPVVKGTRQGGLTSPLFFNLFYKDLITAVNSKNCGITIGNNNYNVMCYADDLLICSTTASNHLQSLIDLSVQYIVQHGLRFNPKQIFM